MNNYEVLNMIGEGAYGVVLKARRKDTGNPVAIKKFKDTDDEELIKKTTVREMKVLRALKHKNIVELQEAFKRKGLVHLVFQYLDNNLLQVMQKTKNGLSNKMIARFMYQVLQGLQYMHSMNYIHRDVKPQNLLINKEGLLKICDMGFARTTDLGMTEYVATRWYRPPELLVGADYSFPIDIWAVGCIMAEISNNLPLFPGQNQIHQLSVICEFLGDLPDFLRAKIPKNVQFKSFKISKGQIQNNFIMYKGKLQESGVDLLKRMLTLDPAQRITASEALQHPYFAPYLSQRKKVHKPSESVAERKRLQLNFTQSHSERKPQFVEFGPLASRSHSKQNSEQNVSKIFNFGKMISNKENIKLENKGWQFNEKGMNKIYHSKFQKKKNLFSTPYSQGKGNKTFLKTKNYFNTTLKSQNTEKSMYFFNI